MFISRIEMVGFKSFASKTELAFRPGIMAVVGPNGCGKSNIVDAVRWVLGEQRTSTLRADKMEEVIFNGTSRRKAFSMAEVTLTIENDKQILPVAYSEVELTRRLYRSGDSEYLINRNASRLRDIQDLFADTGFHSNAYSIIELSMVEGIITGNSGTRRAMIEEASGISGFKVKRLAAERKLEATREHLTRLADIYLEVENNYNTLKRQASKARRYQALNRAIQLRLIVDLAQDFLNITSQIQANEPELSALQEKILSTESDIEKREREKISIEARELTVAEKISRAQDTLKRLDRRDAELGGELALVRQRINYFHTEQAASQKLTEEIQSSFTSLSTQRENALAELSEVNSSLSAKQADLLELNNLTADYDRQLKILRDNLGSARRNEDQARERQASAIEKTRRAEQDQKRILQDVNRNKTEQTELQQNLENLSAQNIEQTRKSESLKDQILKSAVELQSRIERLDTTRTKHSECLTKRARLAAEVEAANAALKGHQTHDSAPINRPEVVERWANERGLLPVADRLVCKPEHRAALASILRPILHALDADQTQIVFDFVRDSESTHQMTFRFTGHSQIYSTGAPLPPVTNCLPGTALVLNDDDLGSFLKWRLSDVVFVPDRNALNNLIEWAKEHKVRLVSGEGDIYEPDGVYHGGNIDADALRVGWVNRLTDLELSLKDAHNNLNRFEQEVDAAALQVRESEQILSQARKQHRALEDDLAANERKGNSITSDIERFTKRLKECDDKAVALQKQLDNLAAGSNQLPDTQLLQDAIDQAVEKRKSTQTELQTFEQQKIEIAEKRASISSELARFGERKTSTIQNCDRLAAELKKIEDRKASLEAKLAEGQQEFARSEQAILNIEAQIKLVHKERDQLLQTLEQDITDKKTLVESKENLNNTLKGLQEQLQALNKQHRILETKLIELHHQKQELDRRLEEDAGVHPEQINDSTTESALEELQSLELADVPLDRLKTRLQAMGAVNMLALDEITEAEQRYNSLTEQKLDLEKGIELLDETILNLNNEARRKFRDTFFRINAYFQENFRTLFEGGESELSMDGDDALTADIRIWATPTGKKLQSLSMMSGGEKALTAIALLFALYKERPSPFCILDEVDAPLDDANVGRFTRLVRKFSADTQFLIVTHNKRTMEAADNLYGVTLSEDGTSRCVSARLEEINVAN